MHPRQHLQRVKSRIRALSQALEDNHPLLNREEMEAELLRLRREASSLHLLLARRAQGRKR